MVCYSACIFTTETKGQRVDPGRYLAQLGWSRGAEGWKLERAVCIGRSGRGAAECELLSIPIIIICICLHLLDMVDDPSFLRMSSRFHQGEKVPFSTILHVHFTFWPWLLFALFLNNCTQSTADSTVTAVIFTSGEMLPFQPLFKNIGKRFAFQ